MILIFQGEQLKTNKSYEVAFKKYQKICIPRSAIVQTSACNMEEIIHGEGKGLIMLLDAILLKHQPIFRWLYSIIKPYDRR